VRFRVFLLLILIPWTGILHAENPIVRETESGKHYSYFPSLVFNQTTNRNYDYATLNIASFRARYGILNTFGPTLAVSSVIAGGSFLLAGPNGLGNPLGVEEFKKLGLMFGAVTGFIGMLDLVEEIRGNVYVTPSATISAWGDKLHNESPYQASHDGKTVTNPKSRFSFADSMRLANIAEGGEVKTQSEYEPIKPTHLIFQEHDSGISGIDAEVAYNKQGRAHRIPLQEIELPGICRRILSRLSFRISKPKK